MHYLSAICLLSGYYCTGYCKKGAENDRERECRNCTHNWSRDEDDLSKEGDTRERARRASSAALTSSLKGALMILPPSLPLRKMITWLALQTGSLKSVSAGNIGYYVGENLILSCALTFTFLAILTKMKAVIKSLTLRSFPYLFDATLSFNVISAASVSPIFPFCAVNQRSLFWKGKKRGVA